VRPPLSRLLGILATNLTTGFAIIAVLHHGLGVGTPRPGLLGGARPRPRCSPSAAAATPDPAPRHTVNAPVCRCEPLEEVTVPVPTAVTRFNKKYLNRFMIRLAGFGPFVEVEHVGRKSGTVRRTVIMAFRSGDVITIALTYGPGVDWLKNVRAAGGCRIHLGSRLLTLGPPSIVDTVEGLHRMPLGPKQILPILRSSDFVEMDILSEAPLPPHW